MNIAYYTRIEGGPWLVWVQDRQVIGNDLTQHHPVRVCIAGRWVHSLLCRMWDGQLRRWDCINGFTECVEEPTIALAPLPPGILPPPADSVRDQIPNADDSSPDASETH